MITYDIHLEFVEAVLGTASSDPEIHERFIASKAPDAQTLKEEVAALGVDAVEDRSMTRFPHMDDSYRDGYQEGKRDGDDDWYEEHESYLEEHGWYQALDADKEPIKFNDDVEWELLSSGETEHGYVVGIKIDLIAGRQNYRVKVVRDSDFQTIELMTKNLHHVKPAEPEPTVEDVLLDMHRRLSDVSELYDVDSDELEDEYTRIIAEYAAKLRLAGSDAE